jgi:acetyl esterase/lipase
LPDRQLQVRVYRPSPRQDNPASLLLVLHVHGGGFMGSAVQSDWLNSHVAARLPAVVVSVEHRVPISALGKYPSLLSSRSARFPLAECPSILPSASARFCAG